MTATTTQVREYLFSQELGRPDTLGSRKLLGKYRRFSLLILRQILIYRLDYTTKSN